MPAIIPAVLAAAPSIIGAASGGPDPNAGYVPPGGAAQPAGPIAPQQSVSQNVTVQASSAGASIGPTSATSQPSQQFPQPYNPYSQPGYGNPNMPYVPYSGASLPQVETAGPSVATPLVMMLMVAGLGVIAFTALSGGREEKHVRRTH